ncbi:hypothetical protein BHS05_30480 [Myxococcus xanthus]|uniref:Lipoprotein n=1 Tax=Myxococcus xanthus TaxID=34 RepID=A0AAE6G5B3_MYXXA|nr:hypothetical protein BHS09_30675 [Myxococcus xanthus]QDE78274.1 hypothetical protein BHS08_30695 [Myxococcus xanthus]QDE99817.1 hypothetical protein BHS05_30480 [Myxococcus xanthus]
MSKKRCSRRRWMGGSRPPVLAILACLLLTGSCAETLPEDDTPTEFTVKSPHEDLDSVVWEPQFEPDYNNLQPQPWVEVVTETQARTVVVRPDSLIFPRAEHPEVLEWEAGKIVVSAPSDGPGANPLGFARRVVSVTEVDDTLVVATEAAALEDIVKGEMRLTFDYSNMETVDISKLDLEWAASHLYVDANVMSPSAEGNPDDEPLPEVGEELDPNQPGDPFLGSIWNAIKAVGEAIGGAARAVAEAAVDIWKAVTVEGITKGLDIKPEIKNNYASPLFTLKEYKKTFNETGKTPYTLSISGSGSAAVEYTFNPGAQVELHVPGLLAGRDSTRMTLNVDSKARFKLDLEAILNATIASVGTLKGPELAKKLAERTKFAEDTLADAKQKYLGNPDMRPAGGWKRNILVTKPAVQTVLVGPVPVVFTQTLQLDLECGFEAKAGIKAKVEYEQNATFKFTAKYENGALTNTQPVHTTAKNTSATVTGEGSLVVVCGLIPRLNVYVYDALGVNAGVRASLVASAKYASRCEGKKATADITLGLDASLGVQVGGRVQPPGTSYLGSSGAGLGWDIGPLEVHTIPIPLWGPEKISLKDGLGFCANTCGNGKRDGRETGIDCGGGSCGACAAGKRCLVNSDCAHGYCNAGKCSAKDHCADGVVDGDETGIDCGGSKCKPCGNKQGCIRPEDCASGYCKKSEVSGVNLGVCVQNHCNTGVQDADESGIDCGGKDCAKCKVKARCAVGADCASGVSNGTFCVLSSCQDDKKSGDETDVDCGGSVCARCDIRMECKQNSDCMLRGGAERRPLYCEKYGSDDGLCQPSWCDNGKKDLNETDVDCGGPCAPCSEGKKCYQQSDCAAGLECDTSAIPRLCVSFLCAAGQYLSSGVCVDVGIGYWSPASSNARNACTNAPVNAVYTSPTAAKKDCPWTCKAGYLRDATGTKCEKNDTVQVLTCGDDEVAVGIHGRAGEWLDALGMRCARFDSGGVIGGTTSAPSIGGMGGNLFTQDCAAGEVVQRVTGINGWAKDAQNQAWCSELNLSTIVLSCRNLQTGKITVMPKVGGGGTNCKVGNAEYSFGCGADGYLRGLAVDSANTSMYVGYVLDRSCR